MNLGYHPIQTSGSMYKTPKMLKSAWARAARRPLVLPPIAANCAVTVVPMLSPRIMGTAASKLRAPLKARNWMMAMEALLLWSNIVATIPTNTPNSGLRLKTSNACTIFSLSLRGLKASFSRDNPKKSIPNPRIASPHWRLRVVLANVKRENPTPIAGNA